jgi:uncharacterized protein (DUF302 family)
VVQAIETTVNQPIDQAEQAVRAALSEEGFGILTEIDVAATLAGKLGVQRPPLKILGACNPELAHRALQADPGLALVLPCNVVLEEIAPGRTQVAIVDPRALLADSASDARTELEALGTQAAASIERAVHRLAE